MAKVKRTDRHEPMPEEVLGYIAKAVSDLEEIWWDGQPLGSNLTFQEQEKAKEFVTLAMIRDRIAQRMANKKEYFTSAYRHANGGLHATVYRILGGTVSLNDLIHQKQAEGREG